jgi:hypothetical protein
MMATLGERIHNVSYDLLQLISAETLSHGIYTFCNNNHLGNRLSCFRSILSNHTTASLIPLKSSQNGIIPNIRTMVVIMSTPTFLYTAVVLDMDFYDIKNCHSLYETNVTTEEKRIDQFCCPCFWMGTVLGVFHQLACLGFHIFLLSNRFPVILTSLRQ